MDEPVKTERGWVGQTMTPTRTRAMAIPLPTKTRSAYRLTPTPTNTKTRSATRTKLSGGGNVQTTATRSRTPNPTMTLTPTSSKTSTPPATPSATPRTVLNVMANEYIDLPKTIWFVTPEWAAQNLSTIREFSMIPRDGGSPTVGPDDIVIIGSYSATAKEDYVADIGAAWNSTFHDLLNYFFYLPSTGIHTFDFIDPETLDPSLLQLNTTTDNRFSYFSLGSGHQAIRFTITPLYKEVISEGNKFTFLTANISHDVITSVIPTPTPTQTPSMSGSPTPTTTMSETPSGTPTATPGATTTTTETPTATQSPSAFSTGTPTPTTTLTETGTPAVTATPTKSPVLVSATASGTSAITMTPTGTPMGTPEATATVTQTPTPSNTTSETGTPTGTPTTTITSTATGSAGATPTPTASATETPPVTPTMTPSTSQPVILQRAIPTTTTVEKLVFATPEWDAENGASYRALGYTVISIPYTVDEDLVAPGPVGAYTTYPATLHDMIDYFYFSPANGIQPFVGETITVVGDTGLLEKVSTGSRSRSSRDIGYSYFKVNTGHQAVAMTMTTDTSDQGGTLYAYASMSESQIIATTILTPTPTGTPTNTPSSSETTTPSGTPAETPTNTPTNTETPTPTPSNTPTGTNTQAPPPSPSL